MRAKVTITRYIRFSVYVLIALLTLEIVSRADDFLREGISPIAPYTFDSTLKLGPFGLEGRPGAHYGKWSFNSLGYRGPEIDPALRTIILFGASETFGIHESAGREYPRQLQEILAEQYFMHRNVLNIAIPGMRHGRVGYLERALTQVHSDLVVIYPSPANYIGVHQPYCDLLALPAIPDQGVIRYLRMVDKIQQLVKRLLPPSVRSFAEGISVYMAERRNSTIEKVPDSSIAAFKRDLECAVEVAQRSLVKVLLVTHATYFGNAYQAGDEKMLIAWRYFYPSLAAPGFLDLEQRANNAVREVAKKFSTELVDVAIVMPRGPDYFSDFVHFNDRGARLFAEILAQPISQLSQ